MLNFLFLTLCFGLLGRRKWKDNIKMGIKEGRTSVDWIRWLRIGTVTNSREHDSEPSGSIKC
jgi:hypothetical protein